MSWAGRWWRVVGVLLLVPIWWIASSGGLLVMTIWGFLGLGVFTGSWFIAAWFDLHGTCQIDGCDAPASTVVTGPNGPLDVCRRCRQELVAVWGYRVTEDVR